MTVYYNENDPKAAAWLRELMWEDLIPVGHVDERSIEDVKPSELVGYRQCHFFAGIGGWAYALRLAGWPDDREVWTGSCPCKTHSTAARGNHTERDWWPYWGKLIAAAAPTIIFSEQVAVVKSWFDIVCNDLEDVGYDIGAAILPAVSVGQDHIRQRLYFVAQHADKHSESECKVYAKASWMQGHGSISPSVLPENGVSRRVALRGFGNAIVPQVAAAFIQAYQGVM